MKKILTILAVIIIGIGMCQMFNKETLTKEQQDNIAISILRGYDIHSIEFTSFKRDSKTGTYLINIKINNNESKKTTIALNDIHLLERKDRTIGLNPIDRFKEFEREQNIPDSINVVLDHITIIYLK